MFLKITVVFFQLFLLSLCTDVRKMEKQILDHILSSTHYDPRIRPNAVNSTDGPVLVTVNLFVRTINRIDDEKMLYNMDIYFRQEWADERLKYNDANGRVNYITLNDDEFIWTPDLFFNDFKAYSHDITVPNIFLRIHPNGTIQLSKRYSLIINCPMDFSNYPFDEQTCELRIESYAWKADCLLLNWKHGSNISTHMNVPLFSLTNFVTSTGQVTVSTGEYQYLLLSLTFKRDLKYYLIQVFIPITMLVVTAYLTFWIDAKQFTARIILGVATLYTLSIMTSELNYEIPKVSYTKAIDIFTGTSLTFVFATLIQTVIVHFSECCKQKENKDAETINGGIDMKDSTMQNSRTEKMKIWLVKSNLDKSCRIIYPITVASFQIVYWTTCLCLL